MQLICKPLTLVMVLLEKGLPLQIKNRQRTRKGRVADHIRVVGREGTNLDPEILKSWEIPLK